MGNDDEVPAVVMGAVNTLSILIQLGIIAVAVWIAMRLRAQTRDEVVGALADEIPYRKLIADGVVECEGHRLLAAWRIDGVDLASQSFANQAATIARAAQGVMDGVGTELLQLDWDVFRDAVTGYPYNHDVEPRNAAAKTMFDSRIEYFAKVGKQYVNETFLALTWTPPSALMEALSGLAVRSDAGDAAYDSAIASLQEVLDKVTDACSEVWRPMRRLKSKPVLQPDGQPLLDDEGMPVVVDELIQYLHRCITHEDVEIALPDTAIVEGLFLRALDLEGVVADQDLKATFQPRIGDYYFEVVQAETFRTGGTTPDALRPVTNMAMPMRTHVRAIVATPEKVEKSANKRFAMFNTNSDKREGKRRSLVAERKASSAQNVDSEGRMWFHWNVKVVLAGETRKAVHSAARDVKKMMQKCKFGARIERLGNPDCLASTWPGENKRDLSESLIDDITLCDLAPVGTPYRGPQEHPNPSPAMPNGYNPPTMRGRGIGNTPVDFYETVDDIANLGTLGEIGSGKTTTSNGLIYLDQATTPDIDHVLFEQGYGARPLVHGFGGQHVDMDPSDPETGVCPWIDIDKPDVAERRIKWVVTNLRLNGLTVDPTREAYIKAAVQQLATSPVYSSSLFQRKLATLDEAAAKGFTPWTVAGPGGYTFDREFDKRQPASAAQSTLICYEMSRLLRYKDPRITGPFITLALDRVYSHMVETGRRVRVHLDEPKDYFEDPIFSAILEEFYDKITRKHHGGIRIFTQYPQQFLEHHISTSILGATKTWFFLATQEAAKSQRETFKKRFDLSDEACEIIAKAKPKRQIVVWQDGHLAVIDPSWQAPELAWIGATDKRDRDAVMSTRRAAPNVWQAKWFEYCADRHRRNNRLAEAAACERAAASWRKYTNAQEGSVDDVHAA